jgi:hypothetical protein
LNAADAQRLSIQGIPIYDRSQAGGGIGAKALVKERGTPAKMPIELPVSEEWARMVVLQDLGATLFDYNPRQLSGTLVLIDIRENEFRLAWAFAVPEIEPTTANRRPSAIEQPFPWADYAIDAHTAAIQHRHGPFIDCIGAR